MSASNVLARPRVRSALLLLSLAGSTLGCAESLVDASLSFDASTFDSGLEDGGLEDGGLVDAGAVLDAETRDGERDAGEPPIRALELSTQSGAVRGSELGEVHAFRGIPYAKPPVGARRFLPPEPVDPWQSVRESSEFGPVCPQNPGALAAMGPQSEDCLTLNVFAPKRGEKLPVMIWIHGGAFISGGSTQYNPVRLVSETGVVIVTLNYRLGALGFFAHPALDSERGSAAPSGNDGLRDQQLALRWIKQNIAAFGGDPTNMTLFGESAGATSTCVHLVSPPAQGLVQRHILQSGFCVGIPVGRRSGAEALGAQFATELCEGEADQLACLRSKPADELIRWGASRGMFGAGFNPSINPGDPLLPAHPNVLYRGKSEKTAVLLGSNKNEWALFSMLRPVVTNLATLEAAVRAEFPSYADALLAHYTATEETAALVYDRLKTDSMFRCPTRALARLASEGGAPAYLYSFEEGSAMHALDIPYLFGNPVPALGVTAVDPLHGIMAEYWTRFAKIGDPNGGALPIWPRYELPSDRHLALATVSSSGEALAKSDCDLWDGLVANRLF